MSDNQGKEKSGFHFNKFAGAITSVILGVSGLAASENISAHGDMPLVPAATRPAGTTPNPSTTSVLGSPAQETPHPTNTSTATPTEATPTPTPSSTSVEPASFPDMGGPLNPTKAAK